jgi:type VI secretion system protein ImpA
MPYHIAHSNPDSFVRLVPSMASPPLLDIAALTAPIPGDDPAGTPAPLTVRQKLEALRKDFEPHPENPALAPVPKKPDWAQIRRLTEETLTRTSKDLETALRLTEALLKSEGFAGLRDGLRLICELVASCWDRLHPIPDEGEGMEVRAERFYWIAEADKGSRLPQSVREAPLVKVVEPATADRKAQEHDLSYSGAQAAMRGQGEVPAALVANAEPKDAEVADDLTQCLEELTRLEQLLTDKCGKKDAPGLSGLRTALEDCGKYLATVVRRHQPAAAPVSANGASNGDAAFSARPMVTASREEAYRQLGHIADVLEQLEPHSPIPYLLRRAIELGKMPFRQLIQELIREPNLLAEVRREFGLRDAESTTSDAAPPAT